MSKLNTINISNYVGKQILGDKSLKQNGGGAFYYYNSLSLLSFLLVNGCLMIMQTLFSSHI